MIAYWCMSYLLGTFLTAYVLGRLKGVALEHEGSGNLGARNAGRVLGGWAFFVTTLGDGLKGAIVVMLGHYYELPLAVIATGLLFVTLGHVYPFWRRFKGGKGVATGVGGLLFMAPISVLLLLMGFLLVSMLTKSSTKGMLGAFTLYGGYFIWTWQLATIPILAVILLIVWANKENIQEKVAT